MSTLKKTEIRTNGEKIGEYTKYQREKQGVSLSAFARDIGVDPSFLTRLERGQYQGLGIDVIEKLAVGFGMTIDDFLRKCRVTSYEKKLPPLEYYLKEMFQFTPEAIEDCSMFVDFLKSKYKKDILKMKRKHLDYWKLKQ